MAVDFSKSKTRENLMRAFAGESQARNRYTIAAKQASRDNLYSISQIFLFTADQERAHAEVFSLFPSKLFRKFLFKLLFFVQCHGLNISHLMFHTELVEPL